jgi:aryl-phospho-beta-D-glucosidase BglC (GH1 family)
MKSIMCVFGLILLWCPQAQSLTTRDDIIINEKGNPQELKGLNWFGFNNTQTLLDGLYAGDSNLTLDVSTVASRMRALGFNAIRLPFSFKDFALKTKDWTRQGCKIADAATFRSSVTPPGQTFPGKNLLSMPAPATINGTCNSYIPAQSTYERYLWVVHFLARNGFYVLVDNHFREDPTATENPDLWVQEWVRLVTDLSKNPVTRERLMWDILNEPDHHALRWEDTNGKPGLTKLYLRMMDATHAINPKALFFIEGTGQGGIQANWGDGFATDAQVIQRAGLSDPNPFFKALMSKPYRKQVVLSPHIYPTSVTTNPNDAVGAGLYKRLSDSFGYLMTKGYCHNGTCQRFPVAVGEVGSKFGEVDKPFLRDFVKYMNNTGDARDGKHNKIGNWFYWSWNPNSGDTGGLVENDWLTVEWEKINWCIELGLRPWYRR